MIVFKTPSSGVIDKKAASKQIHGKLTSLKKIVTKSWTWGKDGVSA